jgi:hypothetical protein
VIGDAEQFRLLHADCGSNAYKPVRCDRCGSEYVCTPANDFYCAAEGDHCCEPCLINGQPLITLVGA